MTTANKSPRSMLEIAQNEYIMRDRIADVLRDGPKTIPEIVEIMKYPSNEITAWIFGMRRYKMVEEVGRADLDGYFKYELLDTTDESGD
jgi:hypothetical protein